MVKIDTAVLSKGDPVCIPQNLMKSRISIFENSEKSSTPETIQRNFLDHEELIPVDYLYKNEILPLIFVNTSVSGISMQEQVFLVKEDIKQVIRYFVDGNIALSDTSITHFFQLHPGTMMYSPQLVKTIVSLEQREVFNKHSNRIIKNPTHEE